MGYPDGMRMQNLDECQPCVYCGISVYDGYSVCESCDYEDPVDGW